MTEHTQLVAQFWHARYQTLRAVVAYNDAVREHNGVPHPEHTILLRIALDAAGVENALEARLRELGVSPEPEAA